jgi:hypothetical protein
VSGLTPRGALRIGDRVRFGGGVHQVVGIEGTMVRLVPEGGLPWLAAAGYLMAAADFEIMGRDDGEPVIPPVALLGALPEPLAERARFWETHILEVLTGLPGDAPEGAVPRPDFDPRLHGLAEREAAKAAELAAAGEPGSVRNLRRLRQRYERQGLWGLVDHRATRLSKEFGRVDERVVEAIAEAMGEQTDDSTGTRQRAWRRAQEILAGRYPGEEVPLPSTSSVYRLFAALEGGRHTFGSAVRRRSNANRPATPFTAASAQRPCRGTCPGRMTCRCTRRGRA